MPNIVIHYDVPSHVVNLRAFIQAAQATQQAVDAFGELYFGGAISFEVVVFAPESGTLKEFLGVRIPKHFWTAGTIWMAIQVMDSPTVREVSTELFGNTPSGGIVELIKTIKEMAISETPEGGLPLSESELKPISDIICYSVEETFQMERDKIKNAKIPEKLKYSLEDSQSFLFEGALSDQNISGIGFSEEDHFPIKRHQFVARAVRPVPIEITTDIKWVADTIRVKVTSPNFDKEDQVQRKWKGKTHANKNILFEISDEEFWARSRNGEITFTENSEMELQIAIKMIKGKAREKIALRVMSVDGKKLATPLSDDALRAIIGEFSHRPINDLQDDLFGD